MAAKSFVEQYIAEWDANARARSATAPWEDKCSSCSGPNPVSRDGICRECLHYHYGYDEAEEQLVNAIMGGAVTAALDATVPSELIVVAVHRAIRKYNDEAADAAIKGFAEPAKGMGAE
jgi:hypothetical protein